MTAVGHLVIQPTTQPMIEPEPRGEEDAAPLPPLRLKDGLSDWNVWELRHGLPPWPG